MTDFWLDEGRWLFEAFRMYTGELPYRDFTWQYPPLSLFLFGWAFRLFGPTFATAQLIVNLLSAALVFGVWRLAIRLMPASLALAVTLFFTLLGGIQYAYAIPLFSLTVYTPAVLVGSLGSVIAVAALIDYVRQGSLTRAGWLLFASGSFLALLGKPECAVPVAGAMCIVAFCGGIPFPVWSPVWFLRATALSAAAAIPAVIAYAVLGAITGFRNLLAGLGGYGQSGLICPWWPTGLGLFGGLAALSYGVLLAALASLSISRADRDRQRFRRLWLLTPLCLMALAAYLPFWWEGENFQIDGSAIPSSPGMIIRKTVFSLTNLNGLLLPAQWWSVILLFAIVLPVSVRALRRLPVTKEQTLTAVLVTAGALFSLRGLFYASLALVTTVPQPAVPIYTVVGVYLLLRAGGWISHQPENPRLTHALAITLLAFAGYRTAISWLKQPAWTTLDTRAGTVHLLNARPAVDLYPLVAASTSPLDYVLDVNYGGGLHFAAHLRSPVYSTQWSGLAHDLTDKDTEGLRRHGSRLILANDQPNFGFASGMVIANRCPAPCLVWRPGEPSFTVRTDTALERQIREFYLPGRAFEKIRLYQPR